MIYRPDNDQVLAQKRPGSLGHTTRGHWGDEEVIQEMASVQIQVI